MEFVVVIVCVMLSWCVDKNLVEINIGQNAKIRQMSTDSNANKN